MTRFIVIVILFLTPFGTLCAEPKHSNDVTKWQESAPPLESNKRERAAWFQAANYSNIEWHVFAQDGKPSASHDDGVIGKPSAKPPFTPKAGKFIGGQSRS